MEIQEKATVIQTVWTGIQRDTQTNVEQNRDLRNTSTWDFPGGAVVKTLPSNAWVMGSIPSQRIKIQHASQPKNQNMCVCVCVCVCVNIQK